ncbi:MAG: OmpA family protein [Candidatus Krumholzibacteriota bacterium]
MNRFGRPGSVIQTCPGVRLFRTTAFALWLFVLTVGMLAAPTRGFAQSPPGTIIDNIATANYSVDGTDNLFAESNLVTIVTVDLRTPAAIELLQYAPNRTDAEMVNVAQTSYSTDGTPTGVFMALPPPVPPGRVQPLDLSQPLPLTARTLIHQGEPVFIRVGDLDQNLDPAVRETVIIRVEVLADGDDILLQVTETGPDTGEFVGYVQTEGGIAPRALDPMLTVEPDQTAEASYVDVLDPTDNVSVTALIDPTGHVFDSVTGLPVDGAVITMINTATGLPAVVFGDDGASIFPATITSGGTVVDTGGHQYDFPPGGFRFPFVVVGDYRLEIESPLAYTAPSNVPTANLQLLPGAPFAIAEPGSRGEPFSVNPGPALNLDVPMDPIPTSDQLALTKTADRDLVSQGDFLQYTIRLQNRGVGTALQTVITDNLPPGFAFQDGSATTEGGGTIIPRMSADGRTLYFDLGDIPIFGVIQIQYVIEVAAGSRPGEVVSTARAKAEEGVSSGEAVVYTQVRDAYFRDTGFITGRVVVGECELSRDEERVGVPGVRVFLEDGSFSVTDDGGRYHFEGVPAGAHVVQIDVATLPDRHEPLACVDDTRSAGRPYSRFVDIQGGTLWRADFNLHFIPEPIPEGEVGLELATSRTGTTLSCRMNINEGSIDLEKLVLTVILPDGVAYRTGSARLDGEVCGDPDIQDNFLTFGLDGADADSNLVLRFESDLTNLSESRDLPVGAQLTFTMPNGEIRRTDPITTIVGLQLDEMLTLKPDVVLRPRFKTFSATVHEDYYQELNQLADLLKSRQVLHMHVTGHSDNVPITPRGQKTWADNYVLSMARARSIGEYLGAALDLEAKQITLVGQGPDNPVAPNNTREGRQLNRRVELRVVTAEKFNQASTDTVSRVEHTTTPTVGITASEARLRAEEAKPKPQAPPVMPDIDKAWLDAADPVDGWVWPPVDHRPSIPSLDIAVQHSEAKHVDLIKDGRPVEAVNFDGVKASNDGMVAVSIWTGIDLKEGENLFVAVGRDEKGKELWRKARYVHYASPPVLATMLPEQSTLTADGKTLPVIAVRLTDRDGQPAREGIIGEFTVDAPHMSQQEFEDFQKDPLVGMRRQRPSYVVGADGVAHVRLQPTTKTGETVLHFHFQGHQQEMRTWLEPGARDWILVGLAEGTVGYNTLNGNMEPLQGNAPDDRWYSDGRVAFYAKGSIRGEWLATLAFDTGKDWDGDTGALYQEIDPDQYFTLYGDGSRQDYDASSSRKLYVKIERRQFYALFGDYNTGLSINELAGYTRNFNGIKSELKSEHVGLNLFANQTGHGYMRDEIRGDGTSGMYYLTRRDLVINSEEITIEVRDRFRSEVILGSRKLTRHLDYSIDHEDGSLYFKEPIWSRDENLNPIFIVVNYETRSRDGDYNNYGGRGAVTTAGGKLELGTTFIHQEENAGKGELIGWDGRYRFGPQTELKGEYVVTDTDMTGRHDAYLAEIKNTAGRFGARAYVRQNEVGFGLGQQNRSEAGTRKLGVDLDWKMNSRLTFKSQTWRQDNLANGSRRDNIEGKLQWRDSIFSIHAGGRWVEDRFTVLNDHGSTQITGGGEISTRNRRLKFSADHEQSLDGENRNVDYPTRTTLGADFEIVRNLNLLSRYEITNGAAGDTRGARFGFETKPWTGGRVTSSWERRFTENGSRAFANLGLRQLWKVSDHWNMDFGLDHSEATEGFDTPRVNENVPPASGALAGFTAISTAVGYNAERWQWNSRFEIRNSALDDKWAVVPSVLVEPRSGLGVAGKARIAGTEGEAGSRRRKYDIRLGLALRPDREGWVILDRLDWVTEERYSLTTDLSGWRIVNHLNLTYYSGRNTQIALQHGIKYNQDDIAGRRYKGLTDLLGGEVRQNLSPRMDLGFRLSGLHSWYAKQIDYSAGGSFGFNVMNNVWMSLGYNFIGFYDADFSAADFTAQGPFLRFRLKFDQETAGTILKAFMGGPHE